MDLIKSLNSDSLNKLKFEVKSHIIRYMLYYLVTVKGPGDTNSS